MTEKNRILRIGIAPYEYIRDRYKAIARGELVPKSDDPKVWFTSLQSLTQVFSTPNKMLLEIIAKKHPNSMTELAKLSGRHLSNLSRTLKKLAEFGMVKLTKTEKGTIRPEVTFDTLQLNISIDTKP